MAEKEDIVLEDYNLTVSFKEREGGDYVSIVTSNANGRVLVIGRETSDYWEEDQKRFNDEYEQERKALLEEKKVLEAEKSQTGWFSEERDILNQKIDVIDFELEALRLGGEAYLLNPLASGTGHFERYDYFDWAADQGLDDPYDESKLRQWQGEISGFGLQDENMAAMDTVMQAQGRNWEAFLAANAGMLVAGGRGGGRRSGGKFRNATVTRARRLLQKKRKAGQKPQERIEQRKKRIQRKWECACLGNPVFVSTGAAIARDPGFDVSLSI